MASFAVLLLVTNVAASALPSRQAVHHSWVHRGGDSEEKTSWLRVRGGEDGKDESSARALTRQEIVSKLNEVPTFTVTNEEGQVAMFRVRDIDDEGVAQFKSSVCFFLDADEAKGALARMQEAMPGAGLKLTMHTLAAAFEHCHGWEQIAKSSFVGGVADEETPDEPPSDPDAPPKPDMRLMGNHALVNSTGGALRAMLLENAIEPGCWQVPVFLCNELQSASIAPAFLRPSALKETWIAAGRKEEDLPSDVMVVDLRLLVAQMLQTDANDWTRLHIVPDNEAVQLALELQEAKPTDA